MPDLDSLTNQFFDRREAMRPSLRTWLKHFALLFAAFFTVTIAGVIEPFGIIPIFPSDVQDPQNWTEIFNFLLSLPSLYFQLISNTLYRLSTEPRIFQYGVSFSVSLLSILTAHEAGHYVACRLYRVDATLPYFIPLPPMIGPAGTLGAFIKIVSPIPSRRAVFDIGVAGPIAGFIALIPILIYGLLTMKAASPAQIAAQNGLSFASPLLTHLFASFLGVDPNLSEFNPFLAASWVGMLVTSLNLIPSGQLDGGHAIFSIFGERIHFWTGRIAFAAMSVISLLGWFLYSSPSGFLFAILLAVMMRVRHPEPSDIAPLNFSRKIVAVLTLIIFILCFVPFPIQIQ